MNEIEIIIRHQNVIVTKRFVTNGIEIGTVVTINKVLDVTQLGHQFHPHAIRVAVNAVIHTVPTRDRILDPIPLNGIRAVRVVLATIPRQGTAERVRLCRH